MIQNAKILPKVYYGLHFCEGVAEYREPGQDPYRILVNEKTIKEMDPTFAGRPVYVQHVDEVDLAKIQTEADGYVTESFFNKADGKHWCKFIVVSDAGHEAIRKGWKLSNAYVVKSTRNGGEWHGVPYQKEVLQGEYEHLAIVPNPRYAESIILTPDEFKAYNSTKEQELQRLANSKTEGASKMKFSFFKKTKVDNAAELEGMSVTLPKSGKEITLEKLINDMDQMFSSGGGCYANGDHMVKVGEEEMSVNALVGKHLELKDCYNKMSAEHGEMKNKLGADESSKDAEKDEKKGEGELKPLNEEPESKDEKQPPFEKKANADAEKAKADAAAKKANFDKLKNAPNSVLKEEKSIDLSMDKISRGKARYGSN